MTSNLLCAPQPREIAKPPVASPSMLSLSGVGKCYRLYKKPQDRLKQALAFGRKRYFDEFWALRDISFDVRRGETVGIIGRNGSGKSTLLQIACGTLCATTGTLDTQGRIAAILELGAGFNPEFTGRENIFLNAAILGLSREETVARLGAIIAFADIGAHLDQPVKTYSSGMFVRLAFSVIAHVDADVLVIDEALAVGDAFFTQKCMRFLRRFREQGTILFVSHDPGAVVNLCDKAIWLDQGKIRDAGPAKQITEAYLDAIYEHHQGPHARREGGARRNRPAPIPRLVDQRQKYINASPLRNDLQVFPFNPEGQAFGKGGARILQSQLLDEEQNPLSWIVGGEMVTLCVQAEVYQDMGRPIVGFLFKDRLGQLLFGDNTCITSQLEPVSAAAGDLLEARFTFQMPILPQGDYSIALSVAEGCQEDHIQHEWIHDAILFRSVSSSVCTGLVGIPMQEIVLRRRRDHA